MTTTVEDPKTNPEKKTTRVIGRIFKDPEDKVSGKGNEFKRLSVVSETGVQGNDVFWNLTIMKSLVDKLPAELFAKHRYAKFIGMASSNEYKDKEGKTKTGWNMFVNAIELQDGSYVSDKKERPEGADEDAPF